LRAVRSVLSDEKKLSIAALSQTLPDRLIEQALTSARDPAKCVPRTDSAPMSGAWIGLGIELI
jgi:hypothetical protein